MDYNGGRTADGIVTWVTKRLGDVTTTLTTAAELEEAKKADKVILVFFGSKELPEYSAFKATAMGNDDLPFYTAEKDVMPD